MYGPYELPLVKHGFLVEAVVHPRRGTQLNVVYGGGAGEKGLLAFDTASGDLRWSVPCPVNSYGSPQLNNILGEDSILMLSSSGLALHDPANGTTRLDYEWKIFWRSAQRVWATVSYVESFRRGHCAVRTSGA